jgi:hypothetical protein
MQTGEIAASVLGVIARGASSGFVNLGLAA